MQEIYQKTISEPLKFSGTGLHSGQVSTITILPGKENQGVIFKRVDLKDNNLIEANYQNVSSAVLCTTLKNRHGAKVSTVEHLLAALYISGIDNALVEINSEEVPIMDGSSKEFLDKINKLELVEQNSKRKYLRILEKIKLTDGEKEISIEPNKSSLEVDFQLSYKNKIIGNQRNLINFQTDNLNEIIEARTFCLFEDIEKIKKKWISKRWISR